MSKDRIIAIIAAISGILLFSSKAVMVKLAYQYEVDTVSLLLLRMVFALPFYLVIAFIKNPNVPLGRKDYAWLLLLGFIGYYLASYFDFLGLQYLKASLERLILFTYPTLVLLISFLVFKEKVTGAQIAGVGMTYLGIVIIFSSELRMGDQKEILLGGILIFLSAATYASYLVGSGRLIPKFGATVFTSYAMIISCLTVIVHYLFSGTNDIFKLPTEVYMIGAAMAVFATVIPSYLISFAIKGLGASHFSIFGSLGPISTIILAVIFLEETLTWIQLAGAIVVISGIYIAERKRR